MNFRYGKIYLKIAKSCLNKGGDYTKNEIQRLESILSKVKTLHRLISLVKYSKLLKSRMYSFEIYWVCLVVKMSDCVLFLQSISALKVDEFTLKKNILSAFA